MMTADRKGEADGGTVETAVSKPLRRYRNAHIV